MVDHHPKVSVKWWCLNLPCSGVLCASEPGIESINGCWFELRFEIRRDDMRCRFQSFQFPWLPEFKYQSAYTVKPV